ncbi:MAG: hypothetical protein K6G30_04475 [Acetatifactor sp.]|nr:hypothetical protein [Acetatifactor sp.]
MKKIPKIAAFILIIMRVVLAFRLGIEFHVSQLWDDNLMMRYAGLKSHFSQPSYFSLVKDMSFPVFIRLTSVTGIPLTVTIALLWASVAAVTFYTVNRLLPKEKCVSYFAFVYVLFMPQAFEMWSGVRLYRNMIIAPFSLLTLLLLIHLTVDAYRLSKAAYVVAIMLGIVFTFTYYIKEDGVWLLCCLGLGMIIAFINMFFSKTQYLKKAILICIPLLMFGMGTLGYKALNYKYFGVYEINTRTGGEPGKFLNTVYAVDSDYRSMYCWTPYDAIEKVFEHSETLSSHPELLDSIMHTDWRDGDIIQNPIPGDHLGWILRDELNSTGLFTSEKDIDTFFKKVNDELKAAIRNGDIPKEKDAFQLVSSTGGYTGEEIQYLLNVEKEGLLGAVVLKGYVAGRGGVSKEEIAESYELVEAVKEYTHLNYLDDYSAMIPASDQSAKVVKVIFGVYRVVNVVLFIGVIFVILFGIVRFLVGRKKESNYFYLAGSIIFMGIALVYDFAISWFSAFLFVKDGINNVTLNFYNIALPGLLFLSYLFAIMYLVKTRGQHE